MALSSIGDRSLECNPREVLFMRELIVLRHAKAEGHGARRDFERRLVDRGRRDAERMGRWLAAAELEPELVVTSPAARAKETAELAIEGGGWKVKLREAPELYEAALEGALDVVRSLDDGCASVLIVGHEPTWSALASLLSGGGRLRLPTAALAHVELEVEAWSEVAPGSGVLQSLIAPAVVSGFERSLSRDRRRKS